MKAESNLRPENKFVIENIIDGKCEIIFYHNIQEITENEETKYIYDNYRIGTNYRDDLEIELNSNETKYDEWLSKAKDIEYNQTATQIRSKRNELLKESDSDMVIDRLDFDIPSSITTTTLLNAVKSVFEVFNNAKNGDIAKYRQELRDITKQKDFPYNVEFPEKP